MFANFFGFPSKKIGWKSSSIRHFPVYELLFVTIGKLRAHEDGAARELVRREVLRGLAARRDLRAERLHQLRRRVPA